MLGISHRYDVTYNDPSDDLKVIFYIYNCVCVPMLWIYLEFYLSFIELI